MKEKKKIRVGYVERCMGRGWWPVAGTGVLAGSACLTPVGLRPRKMVERNSTFDVSRWIVVGGGRTWLSVVTLAGTGAMFGKGPKKILVGFSPRKVVEREFILNWKDAWAERWVLLMRSLNARDSLEIMILSFLGTLWESRRVATERKEKMKRKARKVSIYAGWREVSAFLIQSGSERDESSIGIVFSWVVQHCMDFFFQLPLDRFLCFLFIEGLEFVL